MGQTEIRKLQGGLTLNDARHVQALDNLRVSLAAHDTGTGVYLRVGHVDDPGHTK
jgi:hypothetical protein